MEVTDISVKQVVKHCFCTAIGDLIVQGTEISFIALPSIINCQRCIASFKPSSRNNPPRLRQHYHMEPIQNLSQIDSLSFNGQPFFSYHSLKPTNAAFVSAPIGFIGYEEDAVL